MTAWHAYFIFAALVWPICASGAMTTYSVGINQALIGGFFMGILWPATLVAAFLDSVMVLIKSTRCDHE